MKTIGLLGGMSWESSVTYYQEINRGIAQELGALHSAKLVMISVDFAEIEALQVKGDWEQAGYLLAKEAKKVENAGADFLLIATNTMHKVFEQVSSAISIPVIHIADATGEVLQQDSINKVGLLGTAFTMAHAFYKDRIESQFNIDVIVPEEAQRKKVHKIIYGELCHGKITPESKAEYLDIIADLKKMGAQAVILGCTEIGLLIDRGDTDIPLYDTAKIHAEKAISLALA